MKTKNLTNVFQFLKTPEGLMKKQKPEKRRESIQTNDQSDNEGEEQEQKTTSSNNSLSESEKDFCSRGCSAEYFRNRSSVSSGSNQNESEKENNEKKFFYTSKSSFLPEDFEILSLLGSGAYAKVYKAKLKKTGELFAIKKIDKVAIEKEEKLFQIFMENEFLNALSHPNIVKTFGVYEDEERICIVLEYVPKGTLTCFIEKTSNYNLR